jgi:hypothetical protein
MGQFPQYNWTKFYGDVEEAIPVDMPEPLDKDLDIRVTVTMQGTKRPDALALVFLSSVIWH